MKKLSTSIIALFLSFSLTAQDTVRDGKASFYDDSFHGQETSNGESYSKYDYTAAHRTLPFGTILIVTNKQNKKSTIVRVNDRGPFMKSRVIDLSYAAAFKIGMVPFGVVQVKITALTYLDKLRIDDSFFHEGEVWDCFSQKRILQNNSFILWQTDNWKHAFYMASNLSIEKKVDVFVKVNGSDSKRIYSLVITNSDNKILSEWKKAFLNDGFHLKKVVEK